MLLNWDITKQYLGLFSRFVNIVYFNGKGILLIRNPFKAVLSTFRHNTFGIHANSHIGLKINIMSSLKYQGDDERRINAKEFEKVALKHIAVWRELIENWVKLGEVIVVHFEDVVDDKVAEVERILKYLNFAPGKRRLECMKYARLDFYRRHGKKMKQKLYTEQLENIFWTNIANVNSLLLQYGHRGIPYSKYKL